MNTIVEQYVKDKDVMSVRFALAGLAYMADCDSYHSFIEALGFAKEKVPELFVEDDAKNISDEESIDNYKEIANWLMNNFSERKCNQLVALGERLFSKEENAQATDHTEKEVPKEEFAYPFSEKKKKLMVAGAVGVIAVIAIWMLARNS